MRLTFESFENANQSDNFNPSLGLKAYRNANKMKGEAPQAGSLTSLNAQSKI